MNERPLLEDASPAVSLSSLPTRHKLLTSQLLSMGFRFSSVQLAVEQSADLENALDFLTKGEHGWTHPFLRNAYPAEEDSQTAACVVCGEGAEEHQEHVFQAKEKSLRASRSLERQTRGSGVRAVDTLCPICLEVRKEEWRLPECAQHVFCLPCVRDYVSINITSAKDIQCPGPGCTCVISLDQITLLLGPQSTARYVDLMHKAELARNPLLKWCPTPDCPGYIIANKEKEVQRCPNCRTKLCSLCGLKTHGRLLCEEALDRDLEQWVANKPVKKCPNCTRYIEKNEGCDHMTCVACRHEWCWQCLGVFTPDHFVQESPNYCLVLKQNAPKVPVLWEHRSACSKRKVWLVLGLLFPVLVLMYYVCFPVFLVKYLSIPARDNWKYYFLAIPITMLYPIAPLLWVLLLEWAMMDSIKNGFTITVRTIWNLNS